MSRTALIDADLPHEDEEFWVDVEGYKGVYLVSSFGRVKSVDRLEICPGRHPTPYSRKRKGRVLKTTINKLGYEQVGLKFKGKAKLCLVHRLVCNAFWSNPNKLPEVNHVDGDKANNHYLNLEWSNRVLNSLHSTQVLGKNRGEQNSASSLTEKEVLEIKELLLSDISQTEIAKMFNVTNHAIYRIKHGFNWSWLTGFDRKEAVCHV